MEVAIKSVWPGAWEAEMNTLELLREAGFSEAEARKLEALKQRYGCLGGELRKELTGVELGHLVFVRWLVEQGRLNG